MSTLIENLRQRRIGRRAREVEAPPVHGARSGRLVAPTTDIAPNDPLVAYFLSSPGAVEVDKLQLDSPALKALRAAGVQMCVPLISQGELVGLLNLGPRLSGQDYSTDDRGLLNDLSSQAAPALRVAQLVRQQQAEARERERIDQELRVARLIQQTLLPKEVPALEGWNLAAYYQPARAVGGDFYDFLMLEDGKLGLVIGDVTDKGVPAALVMATTRAILRAAAQQLSSPGKVLERVNDMLHPDIPPKMFVTCLYGVLDPQTGLLRYANAGHDLPYKRHNGAVAELRATGMPLGLMLGMRYEEKEAILAPGDSVLFYSDGLVEAHNRQREMFSFPYLKELVAGHSANGQELIDLLLGELATFTGAGWEQEDDVTLVTLVRLEESLTDEVTDSGVQTSGGAVGRLLSAFTVPSQPGNERTALNKVAEAIAELPVSPKRVERLKTAVAEATMNAMEHGNHYSPDVPVSIEVRASDTALSVLITDQGGTQTIPDAQTPDLLAKLAGEQTPRGWGLFLIKNLVDDMRVTTNDSTHTVELILHLGGEKDAN
ncbi:MAG TPA: SpoIIE family protein phosphatase [Chloroflexia bacterium]|nr:SpoIIE family protein phosphatase [Chloroflexia bacterium]